jgi:hypothetical protein
MRHTRMNRRKHYGNIFLRVHYELYVGAVPSESTYCSPDKHAASAPTCGFAYNHEGHSLRRGGCHEQRRLR